MLNKVIKLGTTSFTIVRNCGFGIVAMAVDFLQLTHRASDHLLGMKLTDTRFKFQKYDRLGTIPIDIDGLYKFLAVYTFTVYLPVCG